MLKMTFELMGNLLMDLSCDKVIDIHGEKHSPKVNENTNMFVFYRVL